MTNLGTYSHIAYADESNWNNGRFRSIALITTTADAAQELSLALEAIGIEYRSSEFKWEKAKKNHGTALITLFFKNYHRMRADVLIWDMEDSRHKGVFKRDDEANFERMYYHLIHNVLKLRWPDESTWFIFPHQHEAVDWGILEKCLGWRSWASEYDLFTRCGAVPGFRSYFNISGFLPVCAKKCPLVQLADLFAGLAAFSYSSYDKYQHWNRRINYKSLLFPDNEMIEMKLSKRDQERLPLLSFLQQESTRRSLQISLDSSRGFKTWNPDLNLNFWLYKARSRNDKAPVKSLG